MWGISSFHSLFEPKPISHDKDQLEEPSTSARRILHNQAASDASGSHISSKLYVSLSKRGLVGRSSLFWPSSIFRPQIPTARGARVTLTRHLISGDC